MLVERANAEREKWLAAINTTFDHIGGIYFTVLMTDTNKIRMLILDLNIDKLLDHFD